MAIGIDDFDDDDDFTTPVEPSQPDDNNNPSLEKDDYIVDVLKARGIEDMSKIKFENEDGQIEERSWDDLSNEEKVNILSVEMPAVLNNDIDLSDEEIDLLNSIRKSNLSPVEYIKQIQEQQVVQEPTYKVDDLSDDELYLLDLESRVGELSDDEAVQALGAAKLNEDFYKKQIEGIRKEYKEREDYINQQEQAELESQQREAFENYQANIVNAIDGFNSVGNLDLNFEDADKEELAEFILSLDESGVNYLYQALQEPLTLVKAAWFILNGDEAFNSISDYFTNLIKQISENQYKKGFEDGKKGTPSKPTVIIDNKKSKQNSHPSIHDIDSLYDEDF